MVLEAAMMIVRFRFLDIIDAKAILKTYGIDLAMPTSHARLKDSSVGKPRAVGEDKRRQSAMPVHCSV